MHDNLTSITPDVKEDQTKSLNISWLKVRYQPMLIFLYFLLGFLVKFKDVCGLARREAWFSFIEMTNSCAASFISRLVGCPHFASRHSFQTKPRKSETLA